MKRRLVPLAAVFALCSALSAQQIIGIGIGGDLNRFDPQTGEWSYVGSSGVVYGLWTALDQDSQGRLFAANGFWYLPYRIYEIDPATAQATFVCQTPLFGINALAFDQNNRLFAANDRTTPSLPHPYDLHEIDLATGNSTLIGDMGTTSVGSLAFHAGVLYGYVANVGLVEVNTTTGLIADVNPAFTGVADLSESICFGPDGQMFQMDAGLWVMDTLTGVPCFVGLTGYLDFIVGIEYLDGPTNPFTLGTLGETGGPMGLEVWGATPQTTVAFLRASGGGGPTAVAAGLPCEGTLLDLNSSLQLAAVAQTDAQGHARLGPVLVPAAAAGVTRLQALDLTTCRISNLARLIY